METINLVIDGRDNSFEAVVEAPLATLLNFAPVFNLKRLFKFGGFFGLVRLLLLLCLVLLRFLCLLLVFFLLFLLLGRLLDVLLLRLGGVGPKLHTLCLQGVFQLKKHLLVEALHFEHIPLGAHNHVAGGVDLVFCKKFRCARADSYVF